MLAESQHRLEQEEKLLETLLAASNIAAAILLSALNIATPYATGCKTPPSRWWNVGAMRADPIDMNIGIDNVAAMFEPTEITFHRGYQNIGLLCANQEQWIFSSICRGWYKAMLRHHMSPNRVINAAHTAANFRPALRSCRSFAGVAGTGCAGLRFQMSWHAGAV